MNDRPQYAVECEALGRVYRFSRGLGRGGTQETVALDDLNLTISPGSVFGLLGPNGAGKTIAVGPPVARRPPHRSGRAR